MKGKAGQEAGQQIGNKIPVCVSFYASETQPTVLSLLCIGKRHTLPCKGTVRNEE